MDILFPLPSDKGPCDIVKELKTSNADILLNYLPVSSGNATRFYAECCLDAGVAFINKLSFFTNYEKLF